MTLFDKDRRLKQLYARVPKIACRGLCHEACGPVSMSMGATERRHMRRALGAELGHDADLTCTALGADKRCRAYAQRPMLCRVFGVAEGLPCPHGCDPERWLTDDEARELLKASEKT